MKVKKLSKYVIVMIRHGESVWNMQNLFCGWYDAKLSRNGKREAKEGGMALKKAGFKFDVAFTSVLSRAQQTLQIILNVLDQTHIPVKCTWRLNERHYGGLTGLNKAQTAKKFGDEQVKIWRRSFDIPPPPMAPDHKHYTEIRKDPRYRKSPSPKDFPKFESLKMTIERTLPYWNNTIVPEIKRNNMVIVAAHGNSLRGIVKHLDQISDKDIMSLNLPTGIPFAYHLDEELRPVPEGSMKFLGDRETVEKAVAKVAAQGKSKK